MKITKIVTPPVQPYEALDRLVCELCGEETNNEDRWPPATSSYDTNKVTVEYEIGVNYPEGGNVEKRVVDICPGCFLGKLLPWIASQGGKARKEERDW